MSQDTFSHFVVKNPLLFPAIGLMLGILWSGMESGGEGNHSDIIGMIAVGLGVILYLMGRMPSWLVASLLSMLVGSCVTKLSQDRLQSQGEVECECLVLQKEYKKNRWIASHCSDALQGKVIVTVGEETDLVTQGALIRTSRQSRPIESIDLPDLFSYRKFMYYKGVTHRLWLGDGDFEIIGQLPVGALSRFRKLVKHEVQSHFSPGHAAIIQAFVLGDRLDLEEDTNRIFREAGAMHILAVSGLHVGIVAGVLGWILGLCLGGRRWQMVRVIVMVSSLWLFAALTGFSASVSRAAFMFSLFLGSQCFPYRFRHSLNVLAASVLCLLLLNPFRIYDIGFQFSHLAVLGIVLCYPLLRRIWKPKVKLLSYFVDIVLISFAAQIFLIPFALYYFGETSVVSVLSSLVCIPAAAVLVTGSLMFVMVSMVWPVIAGGIASFLSMILDLLIGFLGVFADLEWSTVEVFHMDSFLLWLILAMILAAYAYLVLRWRWARWMSIVSLVVLLGYSRYIDEVWDQDIYLVAERDRQEWEVDIWHGGQVWQSQSGEPSWTTRMWAEKHGWNATARLSSSGWALRWESGECRIDEDLKEVLRHPGGLSEALVSEGLPPEAIALVTEQDSYRMWRIKTNNLNEN